MISPIGYHQVLSDNMLRLLYDEELAYMLRQNSYQMRMDEESNEMTARKYVEAYKACIDYFKNGTPLPTSITELINGFFNRQ